MPLGIKVKGIGKKSYGYLRLVYDQRMLFENQ